VFLCKSVFKAKSYSLIVFLWNEQSESEKLEFDSLLDVKLSVFCIRFTLSLFSIIGVFSKIISTDYKKLFELQKN